MSNLNLLEGFPKGSSEDEVDDSNAKEAIWNHWEDFEKKAKTFQLEAEKLAVIAKEGNEVAIKIQFKKIAKTCATCHKAYKSK
jgi:cytochrome c556